ncbi:MAG TPA: beta-galactosidase, partial [Victivallales bacterium]|nr:beta-galactosidase [Victivallales bacterium]
MTKLINAVFLFYFFFLIPAIFTDQIPIIEEQLLTNGSAIVSYKENAFILKFDDPFQNSGVCIYPPPGQKEWNFWGWKVFAANIENLNLDKQVRLNVFLHSKNKKNGKIETVGAGIALNPKEQRTLRMLIPHRLLYQAPKGVPGISVIDSDSIEKIEFTMQWPFEAVSKNLMNCKISNIRLEETIKENEIILISEEKFFPFIDQFGQYIHKEWPEKIHSPEDLIRNHKKELEELAKIERPISWNEYGGWKNGPQLEATGNFRTAKYEGKWYFVDPSGHLFFSHGLDVLHAHTDATKTANHEKWFVPQIFKPGEIAFTDNNLKIKYQKENYTSEFFDNLVIRLEKWGFNTIGNWGKSDIIAKGKTPYVLQLTDYNWKLPRISDSKIKFYDVFDPKYIQAMKTLIPDAIANNPIVEKSLSDPLCIGYFIDNELDFGIRREFALLKDILKSPPEQAIKQEFVGDIKIKYLSIDKLNKAWGSKYQDWNDLLEAREFPQMNDAFMEDARLFTKKYIEQYFKLCRDAIKSIAPHRLYLGCRFISTDAVRPILYEMSKKYCDVLTVNVYAHSVSNFPINDFPDMPVLIGEFHFGILDRGMFSAGLCPAGITQNERALAYIRFMQGALTHPLIVGAHWFQFRDQPLTGRWDGEGYEIGFVDVADTPYDEMIKASRLI